MAPASASFLSALRKARDVKVKELNALVSVVEKLYAAIENVEKSLSGQIEKTAQNPSSQSFTLSLSRQPAWQMVSTRLLHLPYSRTT